MAATFEAYTEVTAPIAAGHHQLDPTLYIPLNTTDGNPIGLADVNGCYSPGTMAA
jgi:hypothetical protein